jgi:hypothetical protein
MLTEMQRGYNHIVETEAKLHNSQEAKVEIRNGLVRSISPLDSDVELEFMVGMVEALDYLLKVA